MKDQQKPQDPNVPQVPDDTKFNEDFKALEAFMEERIGGTPIPDSQIVFTGKVCPPKVEEGGSHENDKK